jgi:cytochrome c biogenesis protein CcmG, thiol:disulfide interchange protein DsbE
MNEIIQDAHLQAEASEQKKRDSIRWGRLAAWGFLIVLLAVLGTALYFNQRPPASEGQRAPNFVLTTFEGEQISTSALQGKVIVVNFWASWCKPCEQEAGDLEAAWRIYKPRGDVVFLGVNYVDTEPEALAYLKKFNITYPNGPDLRTRISQAYRIIGVPETYIIDQEGILVSKKVGPFLSLGEIIDLIDPLLK